jgi:hypothetical protein
MTARRAYRALALLLLVKGLLLYMPASADSGETYFALHDANTHAPMAIGGTWECKGQDGYFDSSQLANVYGVDGRVVIGLDQEHHFALFCRQFIAGETIWYQPAMTEDHDRSTAEVPANIYLRQVAAMPVSVDMAYRGAILTALAYYDSDMPVTATVWLTWHKGAYETHLPQNWQVLDCPGRTTHTVYLPLTMNTW